jgi:uncharacterized protein (TIGR02246 family)
MNADEQAIRDLIALWHRATAAGDVETILGLMAEDAVFLAAGQPPMKGRAEFERGLRGVLATHRVESSKQPDGSWVLARDANLLAPAAAS